MDDQLRVESNTANLHDTSRRSDPVDHEMKELPASMQSVPVTTLETIRNPSVKKEFPLGTVLNQIQYPETINEKFKIYRGHLVEHGKKDERTIAAKNNLPCISFSGTYHDKVVNDNFAQSSGIFLVDIDNVDPTLTKEKLAKLPHTIFAFISPSETGVKAGIRVDPTLITSDQDFKKVYQCVEPWLATLDITIDPSCKDVRRLCYMSHDPDMYINYQTEPIDYSALQAQFKQDSPIPSRSAASANPSTLVPTGGYTQAYCDKTVQYELSAIRTAHEGHRNNQLYKSSFNLFALAEYSGLIDMKRLQAELIVVGTGIGLPDDEVKSAIQSAEKSRFKSTRQPPTSYSTVTQIESAQPSITPQNNTFVSLNQFSLNGKSKEMKEKMLNDVFVLGNVALLGQITAFYASHGTGKTLLTLKMLIDSITAGTIKGEDVFYLNCDDNQRGIITKLELAEKHGFQMLADNHQGFKSSMMSEILQSVIASDNAHGKIIILDTLKKFTDLMNKRDSSEFMKILRSFVSHGGTAIVLAHVNKHRQDNGKLSYAGTTDVADDSDCYYVIEVVDDGKESGIKTVMSENGKGRGDVAVLASYSFLASPEVDYLTKLNSVKVIGEEESAKQKLYKDRMAGLERFEDLHPVIRSIIASGIRTKSEIIKRAKDETGESRRKIEQCLRYCTGKPNHPCNYWQKQQGDKNAQLYYLHTDYRPAGS